MNQKTILRRFIFNKYKLKIHFMDNKLAQLSGHKRVVTEHGTIKALRVLNKKAVNR
ncbi:MAG: hypothetical protein ACJAZP_003800 [Psychromonas sp.]|jgi:hypothetical protein